MNVAAATLTLLMTSIGVAALCTLYCAAHVRFRFTAFAPVLSGLFGLLLVTQTSVIGVQVFGGPHIFTSFGVGYEILVITAWGLLACSLLFNRYLFADLIGVLVCGVDTVLLVAALFLRAPGRAQAWDPAVHAHPAVVWLLYLHVASIVLSYVVLTLAFISAIGYLLRDRGLKSRRPNRAVDALPPLGTLEGFTHRFVLVGFGALSLGIVVSQVWVLATRHAGTFFDPAESMALLSWLLYAAYVAVRVVGRWKGRRLAFLVIAGYATSLAPAAVVTALSASRAL